MLPPPQQQGVFFAVVLGLAAVNGFHVERVTKYEIDFFFLTQIGQPVPREHAFHADHQSVAVVFVSDMARSVAFYRDVLGIPLKFESAGWSEFVTDGSTLALHKSDGPAAAENNPQAESAGQCHTGFQVLNLDVFHERMVNNNVQCAQEPTETFGVRITQYIDPDGMVFSVSKSRAGG